MNDDDVLNPEGAADVENGGPQPETGTVEPGQADKPAEETSGKSEPQKKEDGAQKTGETILGKKTEGSEEIDFKSIVPEGMVYDEKKAKDFATIGKQAGLSNEQMSQLALYGMNYANETAKAIKEAYVQQVEDWGKQAKEELGNDFDATINTCGKGIEALEKKIPNIRQALNETGAGNRIEVIRAMALIGEIVSEDSFRGFGTPSSGQANIYDKTNFDAY